ncbi:group II intron maturase-specific domain-containing protein [Vreelandella sp. V005]|uniref:group II intron maturase-specific domain-containing protein n=1 Tax=Vreelandella sp. V005 TaxID=3459608 RepID=UPI0040450390
MQRVCEILKRGRGRNIRRMLEELVPVLRGWASYFSLVDVKSILEALDGWVRPPQRSALYQCRLKGHSGRE